MSSKKFTLLIILNFLFFSSFVFAEECGIGDASCEIDSVGQSLDQEVYEMSKSWYNMLFFDSQSMLRTDAFLGNDISIYFNDLVLSVLIILFQLWTYYILFRFYSSNGDIEKISLAKDSLRRLIIAVLLISIVGSLFSLFDGLMSAINATVGEQTGLQQMLSPNPAKFNPDDSGGFSASLRILIIFISFFLGIMILLTKMIVSLLFPLFTLFIFLTFANKKALAEFIMKLLIFAELLPAIFFIIMTILHSIVATALGFGDLGLKVTILSGGISMIGAALLFFFFGIGMIVSYFTSSFMFMIGDTLVSSISTSFRRGFKHISARRRH